MKKEQELFERAVALPAGEGREQFLLDACGQDRELRRKVDELLAALDDAGELGFLRTSDHPQATPTVLWDSKLHEGPGTVIGRYKLLQQIGEGGMGVVYMAEQEEPVRRRVALKIIKLGMDTRQVVARFEAERQALALMDHPNIARVLDGGATEAGRPYFVMELVQGVPITQFCDKNKLPAKERLALFVQVCQAIQSAHQKGVIHRDIKPSNVLVTLHHGEPMPKVIDFGIAKATNQKLTEKTLFTNYAAMIGTPAYMSPEQAEMSSMDVDTRTDVYALGVLLYELLTGTTPFPEKRLRSLGYGEMQRIIVEEEPERPSTRLSTLANEQKNETTRNQSEAFNSLTKLLKGDLDWIVMKCLEKDRARRYDTANGLAMDIRRHLANEPVVARPPSTSYRLQKAWRRNKLAFTAAGAVVTALSIGMIMSLWQAFEASLARNAAQSAQRQSETAQHAERLARLQAEAEKAEARRFLYSANLNLAQQYWEQNNLDGLEKILDSTKDFAQRGFEWFYWQRQLHLASKTLRGHLGAVHGAIFSPDGRRIVTCSADHTTQVWDSATGQIVFTLKGHQQQIACAACSPDGKWIVTGSLDREARIWEAASGRELQILKGHKGGIVSVDVSKDRRIVTGSFDGTARVWDPGSGRQLLLLRGHGDSIFTVAFSPDGQRIATGGFDHNAKVWDAATGRELLTLEGHTDGVNSVAFSADNQRILTASGDQTAKVWDVVSGRNLLTLNGHNRSIQSAAFSPDSRQIITASDDQTAKVWDTNGRELFTLKGHRGSVWSAAFSPDGEHIITSSTDQTAKVWTVADAREPLTLTGHASWVSAAVFSPNGHRIVTGSGDQTAKVWEAMSGQELFPLTGHSGWINSVAFSPDGRRIVSGSSDQTARVWDAASGRELLLLRGHAGEIMAVAFSPRGDWIVSASSDQTARVWDAASGRELRLLRGHAGEIMAAAFSPQGDQIVTGSADGTAKLWNAESGADLRTLTGHSAPISSVAFSTDGKRILTGSDDLTVKVWDVASGTSQLTLKGHTAPVRSVAFSHDGQRILSGSDDRTTRLWEAGSGRELLTLRGINPNSFNPEAIKAVAFSPDGERMTAASDDQTAKIWQAASPAQVVGWQEEEQRAAQYLATLQRERSAEQERHAADDGAIKRWLILAPIPLGSDQRETNRLEPEQIKGEAFLRPRVSEESATLNGPMKWRAVLLKDHVIDFNVLLRHASHWSVAYAVSYVQCENEQRGLRMLVGSDDESKVYLNGQQIYACAQGRSFVPNQDEVRDITLQAGLNVLVFKVVNGTLDWQGSIRFTDAQGNSVKGIRVTLDPALLDGDSEINRSEPGSPIR